MSNYLFVNYEYPPIGGGAATACQQIARAFAKRGHHVVVLAAGFGRLQGETVEDGVTVVRIPSARKSAELKSFSAVTVATNFSPVTTLSKRFATPAPITESRRNPAMPLFRR